MKAAAAYIEMLISFMIYLRGFRLLFRVDFSFDNFVISLETKSLFVHENHFVKKKKK